MRPERNARVEIRLDRQDTLLQAWVEDVNVDVLALSLPSTTMPGGVRLMVQPPAPGREMHVSWSGETGLLERRAVVAGEPDEHGTWRITLEGDPSPVQRRQSPRVPVDGKLGLRIDGRDVFADAVNVSVGGLRGATEEPLAEVGTEVTVEFDINETYVLSRAKVVRVSPGPDGASDFALSFEGLQETFADRIRAFARSQAAAAGEMG